MSNEASTEASIDAKPPRGRSNAIVTYATLDSLLRGVERVDAKMDHLYEKVHDIRSGYTDHEARIRALELTIAGSTASRGTATWLWQAAWPAAAVIIAVLSYLNT